MKTKKNIPKNKKKNKKARPSIQNLLDELRGQNEQIISLLCTQHNPSDVGESAHLVQAVNKILETSDKKPAPLQPIKKLPMPML